MTEIKIKEKEIKANVSEEKKKILEEIIKLIDRNETVLVASIVNIPSLQFQKLKNLLKNVAVIKVVKKNIALKAFEATKIRKKNIEELEKVINQRSNFALLFSSLDVYELAAVIAEHKKPARIKPGQISPKDIVIEAGPTDLPAGPAISDLSKVKIKAGIEGGKIVIKERCVLTKQGEKVSEDVAAVLAKLEIMPLSVGLEPLAGYDSKKHKVYSNINVNKQEVIEELKRCSQQSFVLAVHIAYMTSETIKAILRKADIQSNFILNMVNKQT